MPSSERDQRWAAHNEGAAGWGEGPWGNGPWRFGPPDRRTRSVTGARWFPVIVSAVIQLPWVIILLVHWHGWVPFVGAVLGLAASFLLLFIRTRPGPTVALVGLLCAFSIAFGFGPPLAAVPFAIAVVGSVIRGARNWAWATLAGVAIVVPLLAYVITDSAIAVVRPLIVVLFLCLLVGIGEIIRNRRERYRELSRQIAARRQSATEAERVRIARELHDVLAHSLSQISVQAGVGLHLFDSQPERARESLDSIKTTSRQALEEVRGVLGFLRSDSEPATRAPEPDLARLPSLVESFVQGGLPVWLENSFTGTLGAPAQLAVYRIVQESLTNAVRHAEASSVVVVIGESNGSCVVTITDDGHGVPDTVEPGRGIIGMRERAELLGGSLEIGPGPHGGFRIEARIPTTQRNAVQSDGFS
jgi:signal transduction histidine kinase